jgi:hypothetical protein
MQNLIEETLENCLAEDENLLLADGFEKAFLGIGRQFGKPLAIYDKEKCLEILMEDGMDYEEAVDYFSFNVEGSYVGEQTPIFLEK